MDLLYQSVSQCVCLSVSQSVSQSFHQSFCLSIYPSVCQWVSESVNPSVHQCVSQSVCQSVCKSVCQSGNGLLKIILCLKQLTQYHWYYRRNRHLALVRATVIQHPPFNECESCFASAMEWDCPDPSRSIQHQEICKLQPRNFGWMNRAQSVTIFYSGIYFTVSQWECVT